MFHQGAHGRLLLMDNASHTGQFYTHTDGWQVAYRIEERCSILFTHNVRDRAGQHDMTCNIKIIQFLMIPGVKKLHTTDWFTTHCLAKSGYTEGPEPYVGKKFRQMS